MDYLRESVDYSNVERTETVCIETVCIEIMYVFK